MGQMKQEGEGAQVGRRLLRGVAVLVPVLRHDT